MPLLYKTAYHEGVVNLTRSVPSADLRDHISEVLGSVSYGSERIGVTKHGKLTAVVIGVEDLELLEELEAARDAAEFRAARAADDGGKVSLDELRAELS
jgi:prevent-host-death family protein